jgi:hypothetical protein
MSLLRLNAIKNASATPNNMTLHTNGSVTFSNSVIVGGSFSYDSQTSNTVSANSLTCNTATINTDLNIGTVTGFPFFDGMVVQTILKRVDTRTDYLTGTTDGFQQAIITELSANITPKFTTSIITCEYWIHGEANDAGGSQSVWRVYKNNSKITTAGYESYNNVAGNVRYSGIAGSNFDNNSDSTLQTIRIFYYDKPNTTSEISYQPVFVNSTGATQFTFKLNRTFANIGTDNYENAVSFVRLTEIYSST